MHHIIKNVFYTKRVSNKIFFDYRGTGEYPHVLTQGRYAFIIPDTTFQRNYPTILDELSVSWGREHMLFTKTFITGSYGKVFIKSNAISDQNIDRFVVFDHILISKNEARLIFHTSSMNIKEKFLKQKFTKVESYLKSKNGKWKIKRLRVTTDWGCEPQMRLRSELIKRN